MLFQKWNRPAPDIASSGKKLFIAFQNAVGCPDLVSAFIKVNIYKLWLSICLDKFPSDILILHQKILRT